MGLFKNLRSGARVQKQWVRLWRAGERGDEANRPTAHLDPIKALHNLANLANAGGATAGDAGVIAVEVVTLVDDGFPQEGYPEAMEVLRVQYERGDLLTTDGRPMWDFVSWGGVIEVAEAACMLARPTRLQGWINMQAHAAGRGEHHELGRCWDLAPVSTTKTEQHWKGVAQQLADLPVDHRDENHDEQLSYLDRMLAAFTGSEAPGASQGVRQLQEEYAHLMAVPLSSEADRIEEIREELKQLGAAPDEDLVREVRDQLGVSPPPWERRKRQDATDPMPPTESE